MHSPQPSIDQVLAEVSTELARLAGRREVILPAFVRFGDLSVVVSDPRGALARSLAPMAPQENSRAR